MKKMLLLMLTCVSIQLVAMGAPELSRVQPKPEDIILVQALRDENFEAACKMIDAGKGRSATAIAELKKPNVAEGVFRQAILGNHPTTINALANIGALPREKVQAAFAEFVRGMDHESKQKFLLLLLNTAASKVIDLNQLIELYDSYMEVVLASTTALCRAADLSLLNIIQALLRAGANINAQNSNGETPIIAAITSSQVYSNEEIIKLLLAQKGIDLNLKNGAGLTALICAVRKSTTVVNLLLQHNVDINGTDSFGRTALIYAIGHHNDLVITRLLAHNADVNIKDQHGKTALDYAQNSIYQESKALAPMIRAHMK